MTKITRSISQLTCLEEVGVISEMLAEELGLSIDIREEWGEVIFTALSETGVILGATNYIPASLNSKHLMFGSRSGVFLATAVTDILKEIELD